MKKGLTKLFVVDINSKPPRIYYPTNKKTCILTDEIRSFDLPDKVDYKTSKNKEYRYIFIIFIIIINLKNIFGVFF